jgi:hypothetical protein
MSDEELFERRFTHLGLARTLAADATIRDVQDARAHDTVAADAHREELPQISFDLRNDGPLGAERTPDLSIVSTIGEGGMGRVHLARQRSLDRDVAVKTLKDNASPQAAAGLFQEARLTGSLEHPGVIPVHALGVDGRGGPLLVMKRVEGVDWAALLENEAHPHWSVLTASDDRLAANLAILTQVCRTIEFAHSRGVFHRDIKPENVMVGSYGEVYVVDWGIATTKKVALPSGGIVGTPAYMAPEMFLGTEIDERTDVYLLGATLHEVLTGSHRHDGAELLHVLQSALLSKPVEYDAAVPEFLAALCNAATARAPEKRPANARAFRDQIAEFLHRRSALALSDAAAERLAKLQALLDGAGRGGPPSDLSAAYRLATEARFGFTQSLREHPSNVEASAGLRASVLALVDLELRQEHADTAEALLREVEAPEPSLAARVAAVRERDASRHREAQRLEAMDRDLDQNVEAYPRAMLTGLLLLLSASVSTVAVVTGSRSVSGEMTPGRALLFGASFLFLMAVGFVLFRKRLFANAYNQKLAWLLLSASMLTVGERLVAFLADTPSRLTFASNLWIEAMAVAAAAITMRSRLWLALPPLVAGAVAAPLFPAETGVIFAAATMLSFVVVGLALWPKATKA